jgi:RimJ/RimL family protein N-acetyltransferase
MDSQPTIEPIVLLQDGRAVTVRPLAESDRAALLHFGAALHEDDWMYLEDDLRNPDIITRLVNASGAENWRQIIALNDGIIVGYSALRRLPGWSSHVGDIQLVVGDGWRRTGLGTALAQAIFDAARDLAVDKLIVEMLSEHIAGRAIFRRLGFRVEGTFTDHARDRGGQKHDLIVLAYHVPGMYSS